MWGLCLVNGPSSVMTYLLVGSDLLQRVKLDPDHSVRLMLVRKKGKTLTLRVSNVIYCLGFIPRISISLPKARISVAFKLDHCKQGKL